MSDELVISFMFPPSDYVSGITVFKRIIENDEIVDVLHANVKDNSNSGLNEIIEDFIDDRILIDIDCDTDSANCIFKFVKLGINAIKKDYKKIYSRSWLMSNHFLAFEYKLNHPAAFWSAEFSDPLIYDLSNKPKKYKKMLIDDEKYIDKINDQIGTFNQNNNKSFPFVENNSSAYFIAEYLVYLFADNVIFTNDNQRETMLRQFPVDIYDFVLAKSEIRRHPTLKSKYYHIKELDLNLNDEFINIAYFGMDYYGKRHFEALFYALESLNHKYKNKIKLHLYMNDKKLIKELISQFSVKENIAIRKPLDYLSFLNATTKFDVLIVNDVMTKDNFKVNPYLPSKVSDYLGSSSDIWALCEMGSTLSSVDVRYKSDIHDFNSCGETLVEILHDKGFVDEEFSFDEYYNRRLTFLNELYEGEFRKNLKLKKELKKLKREKSKKRFKIF
ncbi:MAG: hypothetical protein E7Z79_01220 [Methanobrevibacter thaueri]|uniref:Glycosyl transferases group 1 n=1 Tax=Methanobrevibacter thaueri TaxID=190975 RepID=A0A8T3V3D5_9EURY|nr:hypothetical protein [Methanobrevibacter thaueri]MBE6501042.1 hypothetical protein [Methanobrevibacter thaueri]